MGERSSAAPHGVLDRLLSHPPVVHIVDTPDGGKAPGVWSTDESCYRFLVDAVTPGLRTLETGSGVSTALFAALGAEHRCITPAAEERDNLLAYFSAEGISADRVQFDIAMSHELLPQLDDAVDLVFIDGAHGFPAPVIDWFYAGSLLRSGGLLVLDDVALPGVGVLTEFLEQSPGWARVAGTSKWTAYRRLTGGTLLEGQWDQSFYVPKFAQAPFHRRVIGRLRRDLRRLVGDRVTRVGQPN